MMNGKKQHNLITDDSGGKLLVDKVMVASKGKKILFESHYPKLRKI